MQLERMTWPEVENYLGRRDGVLIATGSMEQHGPIGLIGTDAICAGTIANEVAMRADAVVAPTLNYTPAPFNTGFPGTVSISAAVFQQLAHEIFIGLQQQGFGKIYVVNGHGANLEPLAAVAAGLPVGSVRVQSWWGFQEVQALRDRYYGDWEGMHATPSEVAITQHVTGIVHSGADAPPQKLSADYIREHAGDRHGPPDEHRAAFPDGRVGSHSALAEPIHGEELFAAAVMAMQRDFTDFVAT